MNYTVPGGMTCVGGYTVMILILLVFNQTWQMLNFMTLQASAIAV